MKNSVKREIPNNWLSSEIEQITLLVEKIDPKKSPDKEFIYLDISGIDNKHNKIQDIKLYSGKNAPSRARQLVKHNDILFSTVRTYLKNIAQVPEKYDGQVASTGFCVLRSASGIDPNYLFYFTLTNGFLKSLESLQRGTSYPAVRDNDVKRQKVPIPPEHEQQRIVAKIEELFSDLDDGIASLKKAQAQLKIYRQAVLKYAFEGKLTAEWRDARAEAQRRREKETATDSRDNAKALLAQIKEERERRYAQQLEDWKEAVKTWEAEGKPGKKPAKPKKPKELPPLTAGELAELPELPEGWCWSRIIHIGDVQLGRQRSPQNRSKDYPTPYIRAANITENGLDLNDVLDMDFKPEEKRRYQLKRGDVVISEASGSLEQVGKPALWNEEIKECCFQNTVIRLRPILLTSRYIYHVLKYYYVSGYIARVAGGVGINHIGANNFSLMNFPVCSISEQHQIVAEIESRLSVCDKLEQTIEESLHKAEALRQSILKKAFEGKLVPQDPNDEPAEKLLERIQSSR